ncbi:MAG: PQQ-like beta-propeller repeat protein [Pirellulaceae bacterium]|nr:PQQ-like beta-propeller repeat protein [Pirellulaceae bacterium]
MLFSFRSASLVILLCGAAAGLACADDWPQWRGPGRDGVWKETGVVERFASEQLPIEWRVPVGPGYSGPTVAEGRVYLTDRVTEPEQGERILCFDAATGQSLWTVEYPCEYTISYTAGPRACVTVDRGLAFALGAMGHLHCLDAGTGQTIWKRDLDADYQIQGQDGKGSRMPIWGLAAAPLVHGELVILQLGAKDACIVALDRRTGQQRWRALDDLASYSAPIIVPQAGREVLVCWTGNSVAGLQPESGEVLWRYPFGPKRMPIGVATPVVDRGRVFVSSFYDGSLMLRLGAESGVEPVWQRAGESETNTDALHCMISTPVLVGDYVYGVDSYGQLRCLDAASGERVWEDQQATPRARWSNIHLVRNGDRWWLFNERGQLIIARLTPQGYQEISRTQLIEPTEDQLRQRGGVCWSHPAFANRRVFARNDRELVCGNLAP